MPQVMMLDGLDGQLDDLDDLGASAPSALLRDMVRGVADTPQVRLWLRQQGRLFAESAIRQVKSQLTDPPNAWVVGLLDPFLQPFMEGALDVLKSHARPLAIKVALAGAGLGALIGILIGRKKRQLVQRGAQYTP